MGKGKTVTFILFANAAMSVVERIIEEKTVSIVLMENFRLAFSDRFSTILNVFLYFKSLLDSSN